MDFVLVFMSINVALCLFNLIPSRRSMAAVC